jgi:hypothetical protein
MPLMSLILVTSLLLILTLFSLTLLVPLVEGGSGTVLGQAKVSKPAPG